MAATIQFVPKEDYEVLLKYLDGEGVILVPETNQEGIKKLAKHGIEDGDYVDYDFGGDADVWVDFALNANSYAIEKICEQYEEDEDEYEDEYEDEDEDEEV